MKARFSLFTKILLWFLLSFALIGGMALLVFLLNIRNDPESPLRGRSAKRMRATVRLIRQELQATPRPNWDEVLLRWSKAYDADFMLLTPKARFIAGSKVELPGEVRQLLHERGKFMTRTNHPVQFWLGVPIPLRKKGETGFPRATLVVRADPKNGLGLFSDPLPWLLIVGLVVGMAVLLWFPLVRNLTRPIGQMTEVTEKIAKGRFDVRVDDRRNDEIGRLGRAINHMASRLSDLVEGQKRFLGDVSHELRSPLTRIQIVLELLEPKADQKDREYIQSGLEEIQQMSDLVGELLSYARAEVNPAKAKLSNVNLHEIVNRVARREGGVGDEILADVDNPFMVRADGELLARGLSNLIRNAIRYAGDAGPIEVRARRLDDRVRIEVTDQGPGVSEEYIGQLFDPFFRPEADRDRDSGGAGLGLAIVKTCVEACGGTVSARNLKPKGFGVTIVLNSAQ